MSIKTATLFVALGIGAMAAPMIGNARVFVDIDVAPPAPQVEIVPAARVGYVWAPGYWNYDGHQHVWSNGHYIREHRGHQWVNDSWEQRGTRWHHEAGHWN
ncbi:MAG: YXWGXW repeat-containing protein [Rudaea sp.]|nr:YXWGXW repeat-containing protein [Rudaea sp.]